MALRELWIVAGVNGAGKTTLTTKQDIRQILGRLVPLNPDVLVAEILKANPSQSLEEANIEAARRTEAAVERALSRGESVLVETVLSTDK